MCKSSRVAAELPPSIRQRTCHRVACSDSPSNKCCDDTCIVEIARRNCNNEAEHHDTLRHASVPSTDEPCDSHYLKAKEAYDAILESLGCICKTLLSLNLDSCCTTPQADSIRTKTSANSMGKGFFTRTPSSTFLRPASKLNDGEGCSKKSCCAGASSTITQESAVSVRGCEGTKKRRCGKRASPPGTHQCCKPLTSSPDSTLEAECIAQSAGDGAIPTSDDEAVDDCCSERPCSPVPRLKPLGKACYSDSKKASNNSHTIDTCCPKELCSAIPPSSLSSQHCYSDGPSKMSISPKNRCSTISANGADIEMGESAAEHVVLSVQGMTCTGCEKKLYRTLNMMPQLSNIKTSLILAQAEFDVGTFSGSVEITSLVDAIEKASGFMCTKMAQSAHELDLIVDGNASEYAADRLPFGVSNIAVLDFHTIRVTYQPKLVGARNLTSDPYFQSPRLAPVAERPMIASGRAHVWHMLLKTVVSVLLTTPVLIMGWAPLPDHKIIFGAVSMVLATLVQMYIAGPWYISAFKALIYSHFIEMDLLVVLSTTIAYVYSIIAYGFLVANMPLSTGSFFETSTLLATLILVGRLVSSFARQRAVESVSIESLQTSTALLMDPETHAEQEIDSRLLQYADVFKALPDTSIATDGTVIAGTSEVDESMVTGEAKLVVKKPGSSVVAGSVNQSGTLTIRLTRLPAENTIKTIGHLVDEAKSSKTKIQGIADRLASYFVPTIFVITVLVFIIWVVVGKVVHEYAATRNCINAMTYAISALIVSCPCAIGLAVPMVLVVAGGVGATNGMIFKTAETIEIARHVSHVIFDKTGTLTQGLLQVDVELYPTQQGDVMGSMILGLTNNSKHPVSTAIASHLGSTKIQPECIENVVSVPGSGIEATWKGKTICAGNPHWLDIEDSPFVKPTQLHGLTMFCVTLDKKLVAVFGLKDSLRPDAIPTIHELKTRSIQISIVSGDTRESVASIATLLAIPNTHIRAKCSPAHKQQYVRETLASPQTVVMFCGDGTNDAPALAQASIGVHMAGGTDVAQSAADAVLVRPALSGVVVLIDLSRAFFRRVVFNFLWSFLYNTFAILLAAGAFPGARIPPEFAGLGEVVSVLPVVAIALQLKWARLGKVV